MFSRINTQATNTQANGDFLAAKNIRREVLFGGLTYTLAEALCFISFGTVKMEVSPGPSVITADLNKEVRFTDFTLVAGERDLGTFSVVEVLHLNG